MPQSTTGLVKSWTCFSFALHAWGLRKSDIVTLEWSHIDWGQHKLSKNLVIGKVPHTIPLTDAVMDILKRWHDKNLKRRFVFNLLDPPSTQAMPHFLKKNQTKESYLADLAE